MSDLILVLNSGSSSLKATLLDYKNNEVHLNYVGEELGSDNARVKVVYQDQEESRSLIDGKNLEMAMMDLLKILQEHDLSSKIQAVGHRVVHGGDRFEKATRLSPEVLAYLKTIIPLAPLHLSPSLKAIEIAEKVFSGVPQVAVFDTAFHQSLPERAYLYGVPYDYYKKYGVRRYGMHGTSYRYVSRVAREFLQKSGLPAERLVIAHLGNGASLCAVKEGKSCDTTMGLTPLEGLIMGTRSGDIDPGLFDYLGMVANMDTKTITRVLNKESGLLGISGLSNDMRLLEKAAGEGDERAQLAITLFNYRAAKLIAGMVVATEGLDALIFSAGIGERAAPVRKGIIAHLGFLGLKMDEQANLKAKPPKIHIISEGTAPVALMVPTNEELEIACSTAQLVDV